MRYSRSALLAILSLAGSLTLAGCGLGTAAAPAAGDTPGSYALGAIQGIAHGGLQPVVGATVKMYATQNNGYGGNGLFLAEANPQDGGSFGDGSDTDSNGSFLFSAAKYVAGCPAGQYAYVTISGGNAGGGTNANLLLMAVLGPCSTLYNVSGNGETYSGSTPVWVNEVSTVAAAYALGNFMSITGSASPFVVNISAPVTNNFSDGSVAWNGSAYASCSGTACNGNASFNATTGVETFQGNGLYHAVLNYQNLVALTTGVANTTITTGVTGATGTIPAAEINSIANALQLCVNSTGAASASCTSLFGYTPSVASVTPANTLQAAMNLAKNPYSSSANVAGLLSFQTAQTQVYSPHLSAAPADWTLNVVYAGGGMNTPYNIALDANDSIYAINKATSSSITAITSSGTFKSGTSGWPTVTSSSTTIGTFQGIATDSAGNVFVAENVTGNSTTATAGTYEYSTTNGAYESVLAHANGSSSASTDPISDAVYVAVDRRNNVWTTYSVNGVGNEDYWQCAGSPCTYSPNITTVGLIGGGTPTTSAIIYAIVSGGAVTGFTISNGGAGYSATPTVTITGGGGTGATATATLTSGVVTAVTLGSGGSGYTTSNHNSYSDGAFTEVSAATGGNNQGVIVDPYQNVWTAVEGSNTSSEYGTSIGILVNGNAATPATTPAYDNSTTAGTAPYNSPKLLPTISTCGTAPYTIALDSSNNGWFTVTTSVPSTTAVTPSGSLCKLTPSYTSSVMTGTSLSAAINVGAGMPEALAMDGNNVAWIPLFTYDSSNTSYANYGVAAYNTLANSGAGALTSQPTNGFTGCYITGSATTCGAPSTTASVFTGLAINNPRQAAIDSMGNLWLNEPDSNTITETLGTAAPTVPLLSAGKFGVMP